MPKGGWLLVIAVGGLATASAENPPVVVYNGVPLECDAYGCLESLSEEANQQRYAGSADSGSADEGRRSPTVQGSIITDTPRADLPSEERAQREKDDLKAQQDMAFWAQGMFWATVLGVVLIGLTLRETRKASRFAAQTLDEARLTTGVAKDTLSAESRPWLKPEIQIASPLTWDANRNGRLKVRIVMENIGRTPATNVAVEASLIPDIDEPFVAVEKQRELSEQRRKHRQGIPGWALFPTQSGRYTMNLIVERSALDASIAKFERKLIGIKPRNFTLCLIGTVQYRATITDKLHQSGFIYRVQRRNPKTNGFIFFDDNGGAVPREELAVNLHELDHGIID